MISEVIYDNFGKRYQIPGVYTDFSNGFQLVHVAPDNSRISVDIDEPVGWNNLRFTLKRGELHGVNAEYTSQGTTLEFDGFSGRDFVGSIFRSEGEDATILFQYYLLIPEIGGVPSYKIIEYEGRLNLSLRKTDQRRISAGLERYTLQSRMEAKWDTQLNLSASRTLTGLPITPPTFQTIPLTGQSLEESFVCNQVTDFNHRTETAFSGDTNGHLWLQFDTSNPQLSEIAEFAGGKPQGLSESDGPVINDEWLFKFRATGVYHVSISVGYRLEVAVKKRTISIGPAKITGYSHVVQLILLRVDGSKETYNLFQPQLEGNRKIPPTSYAEPDITLIGQGSLEQDLDVKAGDKLFLYGLLSFSHNKNELQQTQVALSTTTFRMKLAGKSKNTATSVRALPIATALQTGITLITGLSDRLRSNYYSLQSNRYPVDGCGSRRVIFNGFAARNFKPLERPLTVSYADLVNTGAALDAIGLAYGYDLDGQNNPIETLILEPVQHFYRPVELLRLDEVADYSEESIPAEIYSTVEIGYQDYVTDGAGSLEEVHTLHQVTTPILHESAKKPIISPLVASALAIEQTRREQFSDTPKDGTSYDEKVFIVQCKPIQSYQGAATIVPGFIGQIIELPAPVDWLAVGSKITLSGSQHNNGEYTVTLVSDSAKRPWSFYVREAVSDETLTNLIITPAAGTLELQPETGADFDQVSGLATPDDTLNLRLTPGRMLLTNIPNWAGCLINKSAYNLINKKGITETGLITVAFQQIAIFSVITTNIYYDWLAAGMIVTITGSAHNNGTFTVIAVSPPDYQPWGFGVKEVLTPENASNVNIAFSDITHADLQAAVNKTKIPNNKSVSTVLPATDACGQAGRVTESAPVSIDQIIPHLLFLPRRIKFKDRLSHAQIQRLRLGHTGLLPTELDDQGNPIDRNYGYISLLNESGIRVAGFLEETDYGRNDEDAVFILRMTALDLNDTTSGLDCSDFAGWTLQQAQAADERTRRRIELCRFIDVDPL